MKNLLFLSIGLMTIFFGFSLAQSTGDDSIVDRLFSQFQNGTVQKKITCKNLNATMNALGKSVKLNLTNDPNQVRFNYIKTNFVEKVRTYMNQKLNCESQTNTLNTASNRANKKIKINTKMKSLEFSGYELCLGNPPENSTSNSVLYTGINWTHNINPGICTFVCNTNYTRNGEDRGCVSNLPSSSPFSLRLYSVTGDYIGQGQSRNFSNTLGNSIMSDHYIFVLYPQQSNTVGFSIWADYLVGNMNLRFQKKSNGILVPGIYRRASHFPSSNTTSHKMSLYGDGRQCNTISGEFYVRNTTFNSGGEFNSVAIDFVQYCEGGNKPLYGSFRYNSNIAHSINGNNLTAMKALTCGDGKLDFFEECDKLNNPSCSANCTNLGLSVDLKVNGSNSPSIVNYYDPLIITRQSNGATACYAYGNYIKLRYPKNGLLYWTDLTLPTNTSQTTNNSENLPKHLVAASKRGPMNPVPVSIQCVDTEGSSVTDTVNVSVRPFMYGDADINNNVNFADYQAIFRHVNGTKKFTNRAQKCNADVDLNGKIELADGLYIGMYLSGNIDLPYISNSAYGNGDVNQDGIVNTQDAYAIAICNYNISYKGFIAGNVNGDDKLDWKDSCIIQNYVVGLITNLPYGGPLPANCNNTGESCTKMKTAECSVSDGFQVGSFPIE